MCEHCSDAATDPFAPRSRTVRLHGVPTSLRLENLVWQVLGEIAADEGCTTNTLLSRLIDRMLTERAAAPNFASFVRVTCLRYLHQPARPLPMPA